MEKRHSLKWSIVLYLSICLAPAFLGAIAIGFGTNDLQYWYMARHPELALSSDITYEISHTLGNQIEIRYSSAFGEHLISSNALYFVTYWVISFAQVILIPLWIILCLALTGILFYNRELKKPIEILLDASRKIADNELDFKVEYKKRNELGMLCTAFEGMRSALWENNRSLWRSLEERKWLNSAFSHDLRTPLTVLRGYADLLEKYIPDGRITQEKLLSVLSMMNGQITRLEHYTQKMNTVQKLEDIVPDIRPLPEEELFTSLTETGKMLCGDNFRINCIPGHKTISIDPELVLQVYENLLSNALRYANKTVSVNCSIIESVLTITVLDDGDGFTEDALKNATLPFYREDKESDRTHFGLGLYICRSLCEKCGGKLTVVNHEGGGGRTIAKFFCG